MRRKASCFLALVGLLWLAGCGGNTPTSPALSVTTFSIPGPQTGAQWITTGPDGNLWFTGLDQHLIGQVTPAGKITEFPLPTSAAQGELGRITDGPDGNLWFTERDNPQIGQVTPAGKITEFPLPAGVQGAEGITKGADGNLWFTAGDQLGKLTPTGQVTLFPLPTLSSDAIAIASGPDGNLWFTESQSDKIGRITPAGQITEFPWPRLSRDERPERHYRRSRWQPLVCRSCR